MPHCRQFVPRLERLEAIRLLALRSTLPANIASFASEVEYHTLPNGQLSDPTQQTVWAFPGMQFNLRLSIPSSQYTGFGEIRYSFSTPVIDGNPTYTEYSLQVGKYRTLPSATLPAQAGNYYRTFYQSPWGAPKDPGTVTINIQADAYLYNPMPNAPNPPDHDTLLDTVTLYVEAPTVQWFRVADNTPIAATTPPNPPTATLASPLWFGRFDQQYNPDPAGIGIGFAMARGNPVSKDRVGFYAQVSNPTHYDLTMGFVQVVTHSIYANYIDANGTLTPRTASGTNNLDVLSTNSTYWYNEFHWIVPKGVQNGLLPPGGLGATDSPQSIQGPTHPSKPSSFLSTLSLSVSFQTNVTVAGGNRASGPSSPGGGPYVAGYPIGLSRATWHLKGEAVNTFNSNSANNPTLTSTLNMANWVTNVASGSGNAPAGFPVPNVPWVAAGDGGRSYLEWTDNAPNTLGTFASEVVLSDSEASLSSRADRPRHAFEVRGAAGGRPTNSDGEGPLWLPTVILDSMAELPLTGVVRLKSSRRSGHA